MTYSAPAVRAAIAGQTPAERAVMRSLAGIDDLSDEEFSRLEDTKLDRAEDSETWEADR